jgi:hypothetical protein
MRAPASSNCTISKRKMSPYIAFIHASPPIKSTPHRNPESGASQSGHRILGTAIWAPQPGQNDSSALSVILHQSPCSSELALHRYAPHSSLWPGEASLTATGCRRAGISPSRMLQALAPQRPLSLGRLPDTSACVSRGNSDRAPTASSFGIELVDVRDLIASQVDIVPLLILYCFISSNPTARQVGVYWSRRHWWEGTGGCT